jgi:hypothetical protein
MVNVNLKVCLFYKLLEKRKKLFGFMGKKQSKDQKY